MNTVQPITGRKSGELCRLLEERNIGDKEFQRMLIENVSELVLWMRGCLQIYPITVDYCLTIDQMIAKGKYDSLNCDTTRLRNFKHQGVSSGVKYESRLLNFGPSITGNRVIIAELDRMNLQPVGPAELFAFGAQYPIKQQEYPIVELGSIDAGYVICLSGDSESRCVNMHESFRELNEHCRYLAIPK